MEVPPELACHSIGMVGLADVPPEPAPLRQCWREGLRWWFNMALVASWSRRLRTRRPREQLVARIRRAWAAETDAHERHLVAADLWVRVGKVAGGQLELVTALVQATPSGRAEMQLALVSAWKWGGRDGPDARLVSRYRQSISTYSRFAACVQATLDWVERHVAARLVDDADWTADWTAVWTALVRAHPLHVDRVRPLSWADRVRATWGRVAERPGDHAVPLLYAMQTAAAQVGASASAAVGRLVRQTLSPDARLQLARHPPV